MRTPIHAVLLLLGLSVAAVQGPRAETHADIHAEPRKVELSPGLLDLLRAEMAEISKGMQGLVVALASADWPAIMATSAKLHESYIMARQLTPEQAAELERALPARFKQLDAEFHARAAKLEAAAVARDAELALFHYSRLAESCAACHSAYAVNRFPGFGSAAEQGHHHH